MLSIFKAALQKELLPVDRRDPGVNLNLLRSTT